MLIYPASPQPVDESLTRPTAGFRREVKRVLLAIFAFLVVYLVLLGASALLAIWCFYLGFLVLTAGLSILTVLGGLGLMGVGVMVFVFLIKFLFAVNKTDRSGMTELTEQEQPELFAFIRQLTSDTATPFPKKIYLARDVNASVFYDSGFWSMFLPIRKNLLIGLGLVNALSVSEFKAVMAHEFGHFSQRSMKLGSYVYNVNRIIYNLLFENSGYAGFLKSWAEIHGIFALFAMLTARIAQAIQWILRQMYGLINKSYMSLSREMEFHADAVSASVSGSESLVSALRRIELAAAGYNLAIQKCDDLFREKKISRNIYRNHSAVLKQLGEEFKLPLRGEIPVVNDAFLENQQKPRVNFKDQWASHPSTRDREQHLKTLDVRAAISDEPAWVLFRNKEQLEENMTEKIYEGLEGVDAMEKIRQEEFVARLQGDMQRFTLPPVYEGFYDNRQLPVLNIDELISEGGAPAGNWDTYFNAASASLPGRIQSLANDVETVKAIEEKKVDVKTFDFDGVKYRRSQAGEVRAKLEEEGKALQAELEHLDRKAFQYLCARAREKGKDALMLEGYRRYFSEREKMDRFLALINKILEGLQPIFSGETIPVERINVIIDDLKQGQEPELKRFLQEWLDEGAFDHDVAGKQEITEFLGTQHSYFDGTVFHDRQLISLHQTLTRSWEAVNKSHFFRFRKLLQDQVEWTEGPGKKDNVVQ